MSGACLHCGKPPPQFHNYCDWTCNVAHARANGARELRPNGLPIRCITASGLMLECEHGDHPDYKFPIEVEFLGPIDSEDFRTEEHALIYTDGSVALTIYECCYATWSLRDGWCIGGSLWKRGAYDEVKYGIGWRLTDEARSKIRGAAPERASHPNTVARDGDAK